MPTLRSRTLATAASYGHDADGTCASSKIPTSPPAHASSALSGAVPEPLLDPITPALEERELSVTLQSASRAQPVRRGNRRQATAIVSGGRKSKLLEKKLEFKDGDAEIGADVVEAPQRRGRRVNGGTVLAGTESNINGACAVTQPVDKGKKKAEEGVSVQVTHQKVARHAITATQKVMEATRDAESGYRLKMDKGKRKVEEVILVSDDEVVMYSDEEEAAAKSLDLVNKLLDGRKSENVREGGEGSQSGIGFENVPIDVSGGEEGDAVSADLDHGSNGKRVYGRRRPKAGKVDPRTRFLEIARRRAAHFAHFSQSDGEKASTASHAVAEDFVVDEALNEQKNKVTEFLARVGAGPERRHVEEAEIWPGPYSTARQLVEERQAAVAARQESIFAAATKKSASVEWERSRPPDFKCGSRVVPTLYDMSMSVLCANIEHVVDLRGIEEADKKSIAIRLCARRKMTPAVLSLYFQSRPTDVKIPDCSGISEENLTEAFREGTENFEALDLGMCGRGLSDKLCDLIWGQEGKLMPMLHTLSLKGAYNITDTGLRILARASPSLSTVNLTKCNMISPSGIEAVADSVGSQLETIHLCDCSQLDASRLLPSLQKMTSLQSLSLYGINSLTDDIVIQFVAALGPHLLELSVGSCKLLSDRAVCAISLNCPMLRLLDLSYIPSLTDASMAVLTESCGTLKALKLQRGKFSEKAVTSFIISGGNLLSDLSLNSVREVGDSTLAALAKYSRGTLKKLDLSFCRGVTDKGLGLLADSCLCLHELRLFGCTQVTSVFLEGHSNSVLEVFGLDKVLIQRH